MHNLNVYENVLKFRGLDSKSYEVDFGTDELVVVIKRKLSKKLNKHYKNVVFMFKNKILFDDKLISDYKIESNEFILWFEGEDCVRYSNDDSDIIKCITIIDHYNDDEYFINMNKNKTVRMLKSIIARKYGLNDEQFYLEYNKNNLSINNDATLEQCGLLSDGCRIDLFHKNIIKLIIHGLSIFEYNLSKFTTVGQLKQICSYKTNIKLNEISLRFNEKCLSDDEITLEQCGLSDGCRIELVYGNMIRLHVNCGVIHSGNRRCSFIVNKYSTVDKFKQLIGEKINVCSKKIDLQHNGLSLLNDSTLDRYHLRNESSIHLIKQIKGGGCILYNTSIIPLSNAYKSFQVKNVVDLNDFFTRIITKNNIYYPSIDQSLIKFYSDIDKINQITNNQDLRELYNNDLHDNKIIKIYYEIISKLDEFEKIEKLGEGSFGKVYKYKNKNTNQITALKEFDLSTSSAIKETFRREVDCYLKLKSHLRIIKYENHFIENHKLYILMEYMERGSLGSYVKGKKDPFSENIIAKYARQILEGLEYLHYNRILHRDLKGDNILLDEKDDLKLCDFGLAKILTDISSGDFLNGVVQSIVATLNWMSPEIVNGEPCGPASDIWSFGATMVEIITRRHPHEGLHIGKIVSNIQAGKLKCDYPANSSNDMKSFINSCLKRNPRERANIKDLYQKSFLQKNYN